MVLAQQVLAFGLLGLVAFGVGWSGGGFDCEKGANHQVVLGFGMVMACLGSSQILERGVLFQKKRAIYHWDKAFLTGRTGKGPCYVHTPKRNRHVDTA